MTTTVLVTGAARRIGRALCLHFHAKGWSVVLHARQSISEAQQLSDQLNKTRAESAHIWYADFCDASSLPKAVHALRTEHPSLSAVIHNAAAFFPNKSGDAISTLQLMQSNTIAPMIISELCYPTLATHNGSILYISDAQVDGGHPDYLGYYTSKAALNYLSKQHAKKFSPHVRVNTLSLGPIVGPEGTQHPDMLQSDRSRKNLLQKPGNLQEVCEAAWFMSTIATHTTGENLCVNGG
jgi:pteridine reductase